METRRSTRSLLDKMIEFLCKNKCEESEMAPEEREKAYKWTAYYRALIDEDDGP